mmetsp:Transcript_49240/g.119336  ORF Transcript_49240/g.119336 Transcript_49240/m.119336 type:complete len:1086 (-) Transcript_49240:76-3333(-)
MADSDENNDNDADLYDEFGNYIGPEIDSSDDEDDDSDEEQEQAAAAPAPDDASDVSAEGDGGQGREMIVANDGDGDADMVTADPMNAIVLHEDKEHYASAEDTFGHDVKTAVLDEDAMELDQPLVEPVVTKSHHVADAGAGFPDEEMAAGGGGGRSSGAAKPIRYNYPDEFLTGLLSNETTETRRSFALIGHLHHGKTTLVDTLLEPSLHEECKYNPIAASSQNGALRYTDLLKAEQERQMSLVSTPMTMALPDTRGKSYALTLVDCPGHSQFHDESVAALRLVDGAVVCIDAVEGIMLHTQMLLKHLVCVEGLPFVLCITKIDRLIVELQLPPRDAYYKLLNIVESVNEFVRTQTNLTGRQRYPPLSPSNGNVLFSSAVHGWMFTLQSFAQVYAEHFDDSLGHISSDEFSKKLWGDYWFDSATRTFKDDVSKCSQRVERTFVSFVMEPLYKIYSVCLGESESDVKKMCKQDLNGSVVLTQDQLRSSSRPLLRMVLSQFLETASCGFVDMVVKHLPSPKHAAKGKVARCYSGPLDSPYVQSMMACQSSPSSSSNGDDNETVPARLVIHVSKLYSSSDGNSFDAFGRIYSGTCRPAQRVKVLGEGYVPDEDDEDMAVATIEAIYVPRGRSRTQVTLATAGNWVFLTGVDATIAKTATLVGVDSEEQYVDDDEEDNPMHIFNPLKFPYAGGESTMKMAMEPLLPAELPKMIEGLRRVSKAYPMVKTRVEESGEHVVFGTGELYMDCVLHDLRHVYADIEVKVADPVVAFRETVIDTSSLKCFAETANKKNKLTFIAEPLDEGMAERLETGKVKINEWEPRKVGRFFQSQYGWDLLSSRSVWAFGDSPTCGTNLLMDDTLPSEVDKNLLNSCKSSIVLGFQWATREGPLCEEPVRGTKLKILEATLADKPIHRGGGQIIPTARRTVHSSLLTATPRLMEPIYQLQIQCPGEIVDSIQSVLKRRRGHIVQDRPIPGTLLYSVRGFIPVLDSFGFETDLRTFTQGQAMVHSVFDHWAVVPGDPLDKTIMLHPLEPSPPQFLARELLLKTRRRKGLSEDVSIDKFFDEAMKVQMHQEEEVMKPLIEEVNDE